MKLDRIVSTANSLDHSVIATAYGKTMLRVRVGVAWALRTWHSLESGSLCVGSDTGIDKQTICFPLRTYCHDPIWIRSTLLASTFVLTVTSTCA